jgi:menaquinone-dependent protoporphyrinogen oxidase
MKAPPEANCAMAAAFLAPVCAALPGVTPVATGLFAGAVNRANLNFFGRLAMRIVKAEEADHRDWPAIDAWATDLAKKLA